ncbi:hypothetical protein BH09ACT6_BH09ACT6_13240 [soil metagenome]
MNNTNRGLNRLGIALFGLVLLIAGAALAVVAAVPDILRTVQNSAADIDRTTSDAFADTPLTGIGSSATDAGHSWILLVIIALAIVLIVLLLIAIFRQGHGRTGRLLSRSSGTGTSPKGNDGGSIIVDSAVAEKSITAALKHYPGIASAGVATYSVKGVPTLSISVSARRGVSPRDIRDHVHTVVQRWDETLGEVTPVLLRINGGFVSRTSKAVRVSV